MAHSTKQPTRRKQFVGATLIEVLVSLVILALGLLGLAGLQMSSITSNHSAYLRSQATLLAYDLTDRMRSTRQSSLTGAYDDGAAGDRAAWDASVIAVLGDGATGTLNRNGRVATITIRWNDNRGRIKQSGDTTTVATESFVYRTEI